MQKKNLATCDNVPGKYPAHTLFDSQLFTEQRHAGDENKYMI